MNTTKSRLMLDWFYQQVKGKRRVRVTSPAGVVSYDETTYTTPYGRVPSRLPGSQITVSENHPEWRTRSHGFTDDIGGSFFSQRQAVVLDHPIRQSFVHVRKDGSNNTIRDEYNGPLYIVPPNDVPYPSVSLSNLGVKGAKAIALCKPTNQVADLATFMAELYREGLPKLLGSTLWKSNIFQARNAGEEYLNLEFGWKPLVSDVRDIHHAVTHSDAVLEQYERGSGRMTRRRYEFPIAKTLTVTTKEGGFRPVGGESMFFHSELSGGTIQIVTRTWTRSWFSGAFTYHLPTGYRSRNALINAGNKARALLGSDLTPEVLWNAAPWSWAIDWFSNAGDVISNLSDWSTDGLVLKYGYIMEHSFITSQYVLVGDTSTSFKKLGVYPSPITSYVETKRREAASPFGFGLTWSGLTTRQKAIATALGLTRR